MQNTMKHSKIILCYVFDNDYIVEVPISKTTNYFFNFKSASGAESEEYGKDSLAEAKAADAALKSSASASLVMRRDASSKERVPQKGEVQRSLMSSTARGGFRHCFG